MWQTTTVSAVCIVLLTRCQGLSKTNDLDELALVMMMDDPPERRDTWVDPNSMGELPETSRSNQPMAGTPNSGNIEAGQAAKLFEVLGELAEGQKTILQAIERSNQTADHKVICNPF